MSVIEPYTDEIGRFLPMRDVEKSVGLRKSKIYELMKDYDDPFPAPIHLGARSVWIEREVAEWKIRRIEKQRKRKAGCSGD